MTGTDLRDSEDELLGALRRANPVDADALAAPTDPEPARLLEEVLADSGEALSLVHGMNKPSLIGAPNRQRWISAAAAAVVIALVAVATIVVYDTGTGRDATAAVHQAVETTIQVSDSATSSTAVTFDFDGLAEPWEMTIEGVFSDGNFAYRLTSGPAVPEMGIPDLGSYAEVVVANQAYRSIADGPWDGPHPYVWAQDSEDASAPVRSNLTFGVAFDDLGELYDFSEVGGAELGGIDVAHYRTYATPAGAGAGFLMSLGMFMTMTNQQPPERLDNIQLDVWVDRDDLIRRVSYTAVINGTGTFSVVTDWDDFGEAPPITAPVS
ncbi:MAG: hypothetical protein OXG57_14135 [Acidimicrobiaceae bacterium]|nr:hypothetical protein [Acidimicrobiaceae bacterium]